MSIEFARGVGEGWQGNVGRVHVFESEQTSNDE